MKPGYVPTVLKCGKNCFLCAMSRIILIARFWQDIAKSAVLSRVILDPPINHDIAGLRFGPKRDTHKYKIHVFKNLIKF